MILAMPQVFERINITHISHISSSWASFTRWNWNGRTKWHLSSSILLKRNLAIFVGEILVSEGSQLIWRCEGPFIIESFFLGDNLVHVKKVPSSMCQEGFPDHPMPFSIREWDSIRKTCPEGRIYLPLLSVLSIPRTSCVQTERWPCWRWQGMLQNQKISRLSKCMLSTQHVLIGVHTHTHKKKITGFSKNRNYLKKEENWVQNCLLFSPKNRTKPPTKPLKHKHALIDTQFIYTSCCRK